MRAGEGSAKERAGEPDRSVSRSATPLRRTMRPRCDSGFWSKNSRMKPCALHTRAASARRQLQSWHPGLPRPSERLPACRTSSDGTACRAS